jgi:VWFA-related protein
MMRFTAALAVLVVFLTAPSSLGSPQVGSGDDQRTVFVTVVDDKGAAVPGLSAQDFAVKEDGKVRPIVAAGPASAPLTVALMVDDSGVGLQSMREGAAAFVDRLRGRASVAIFRTSGRTIKIQDYTDSPAALIGTINKLYASNTTGALLVEGMLDLTRDFAAREVKRPVIMAVGNEGEDFSRANPSDVTTALMRTKTQLYMVRLGRPVIGQGNALGDLRGESNADEQTRFNAVLGQAPGRTGGRIEQLASHTGIPKMMADMATELAGQYEITFTVGNPNARDVRLEVTSTRRGLKVRAPARTGTFR